MKKLLVFLLVISAFFCCLTACVDNGDNGGNTDGPTGDTQTPTYTYNDFTDAEKSTYTDQIGISIPFFKNNEYTVSKYEENGLKGVKFVATCDSEATFNAYRTALSAFAIDGTKTDGNGNVVYMYSQGDVLVDVSFYEENGVSYVKIDAYIDSNADEPYEPEDPVDPEDPEDPENPEVPVDPDFAYTAFTQEEKDLYMDIVGLIVPYFNHNDDEYYVESYRDIGYEGVYFSVACELKDDFDAYLEILDATYTNDGDEVDEYGDTVYYYSKNDVTITACYYEYEGVKYVDVDAYVEATFTEFTAEEIATFTDSVGYVIPFVTNIYYAVTPYDDGTAAGVYFSAITEDATAFETYHALYAEFTSTGTYEDEYGDTVYCYTKDELTIEVCGYASAETGYYGIDVNVYVASEGGEDPVVPGDDFTDTEKATYTETVGFVIPYLANNQGYYVEAYEEEGYKGVYFAALCSGDSEFTAYLALFTNFVNEGTEVDAESGTTWYLFSKDDIVIDACGYTDPEDGNYYVIVDAYYEVGDTPVDPEDPVDPEQPEVITTIAGALAGSEGASASLTGTVSGIYQAWSDQHSNMSYYLTDGTDTILVFRAGGAQVGIGDEVSVVGTVTDYNGTNQIAQGGTTTLVNAHVCSTFTEADCYNAAVCTVCGEANGEALGHTEPNEEGNCDRCGTNIESAASEVTVSNTIANIADQLGWTNSTQYASFALDTIVTVSSTGTANTGKYYTSGEQYRTYQTENPTLTISVAEGYTIVSVKITYTSKNTGTLTLNGNNVASAVVTAVNASSITFGVGNTGSATNGQANVTAIEVIYKAVGGGSQEPEDPEQPAEPVVLATPVVTVDDNGTASWEAVDNAVSYAYLINEGPVELSTTELFVQLENGQSIKVKAVGDGTNYTNSAYSAVVTYTATTTEPEDPEQPVDPENPEPEDPVVSSEVSLSFEDKVNRTVFTENQQVWEQNGIIVTNDKAGAQNVMGDYANPVRFYGGSTLKVEYTGMTKIVFTCGSSAYATTFKNSIADSDNYASTVEGSVVTVVLNTAVNSFEVTISAQVRMNSIDVTATAGGSQEPETPVEPEDPEQPAEPVVLTAPVVTVNENGVASWEAVANAVSYVYVINDGEEVPTTELSVQLENGQSIKVKAVGNGTEYTDSAFSAVVTFTAPTVEPEVPTYTNTDFTNVEKDLYVDYVGIVVPFIANNNYAVGEYANDIEGKKGVLFLTTSTEEEFEAYLALYTEYTLVDEVLEDETMIFVEYTQGDVIVDVSFDKESGDVEIDAYVAWDGQEPVVTTAIVTKTAEEIAGIIGVTNTGVSVDGTVIDLDSFISVKFDQNTATTESKYYADGIRLYQNGATLTITANNSAKLSSIVITAGDSKTGNGKLTVTGGTLTVSGSTLTITPDSGVSVVVVTVAGTTSDDRLYVASLAVTYSAVGAGVDPEQPVVPSDPNGVREVNLANATNVKNVTDLGYYVDGCPTTGSPAVLVIPVEFSDITASSKGYSIEKLKSAFYKDGETDYYSVYDYFYTSSYGKLTLDITVLDSWFKPQYASTYYASQTMDYYGNDQLIGDQLVMDEALAYLEGIMDLSEFDSDNNGIIDSVVLITTLDINYDSDFHWAYRYWNIYTDENEYYYEYDGVSANDYLWCPYQFLHDNDESGYNNDPNGMNTYTFIHEFGHVLGADDYYDTAYVDHPMGGHDIMDSETGDHNPYTKFNYGWITESRLIVTETTVTVTLQDFATAGDTIILANNWSDSLGAYQEYYVLIYYTNNGLNAGDGFGYFEEEGILMYHVNATLEYEQEGGYYIIKNSNTDASDTDYGTEDNLIEFVNSRNNDEIYEVGEYLGAVTDDNGTTLPYTFTVDSIADGVATLTFTRK